MIRSPLLAAFVLLLTLATGFAHAEPAGDLQPVNINTASTEELASLDGIGDSKAQAIVAYRDSNGPFQSTAELANVRGIGDVTVEKNAPRLTVE